MTLKQLKKQLRRNTTALENFTALQTYCDSIKPQVMTQKELTKILTLIDGLGGNPGDLSPPALIKYLLEVNHSTTIETLDFLNFLITHSNVTLSIIQHYRQILLQEICKNQNIILWNWLFDGCGLHVSENDYDLLKTLLSEIDKNPDPDFIKNFFPQILDMENSVEPLCLAAQYGCYNLTKYLVDQSYTNSPEEGGNIITTQDRYSATPLQYTIIKKQLEIMNLLLSYNPIITEEELIALLGTVIHEQNTEALLSLVVYLRKRSICIENILDSDNWTFLHVAIVAEPSINSKPSKFLDFLLRQFNSRVTELRDQDGRNLAVFACVHNKPFVAQFLLDKYPSLSLNEKRENNINALHDAIEFAALSSAKWLIKTKGFDINEQTTDGQSALLIAVKMRFYPFVILGLEHSATNTRITDNKKRHLGHYLIFNGKVDLVKYLLENKKIDLLAQDADGLTMLDFELKKTIPDVQTLNLLFDMMDDMNKKDKEKGNQLILNSPYLKQFILFFCESYRTFDLCMVNGQKPLHIACQYVDFDFAQQIISTFQLNINERNQIGETVFCYLIKNQPLKNALLFYDTFSPDLRNLDSRDSSVLHISVELELYELVEWCVTKTNLSGCILDQRKHDKLSALDIALIKRNLPILTCLWNKLDENKRSVYLRKLKATKADQYNYLVENDLVKEIKVAQTIELEEPLLNASLFRSEKVKSPDSIADVQLLSLDLSLEIKDDKAPTNIEKDTQLTFSKSTFIEAIKENKVDRLNANASEWIGKPICYSTNPHHKYLLDMLKDVVKAELSREIDIHLYGSSIYKTNPNDCDLLFSSIDTLDKQLEVYKFIDYLCQIGGNITVINQMTGELGYCSPQKNPTRRVIPMTWRGFQLDLVIVETSQSEHAKKGDFTVATLYFNLRTFSFENTDYPKAYSDLRLKHLDTIIDPEESFRSDLSRLFRAVRILASGNDFILSERCVAAIQRLFCGTENHFANPNMLPCGKLYQQLELLFSSNNVQGNIEILASLGVLNSLLTHLDALTNQRASCFRQLFVQYQSMSSLETSPTYQGNSFSFFAGTHPILLPQTTHPEIKLEKI